MAEAGSWSETKLWAAIKEDESSDGDEVRSTLNPFMEKVESVLDQAGTSGQSYTLHDGGHSFRVAERMCEVIPSDVFDALSLYEYALLLLSAYLHDIGMTPEAGRLISHREFLLGKKGGESLSEAESEAFVAWLDANGVAYPADNSILEVEWILEGYVRDRHVAWGEDWTMAHTEGMSLRGYPTWRQDLCNLCRSHQQGYEYLESSDFEPKRPNSNLVHLRYLALVLRMADVLEFDPERTPEAVYRHRAIDPGSKIYWHKDHEISLDIENAERVLISAHPPSALIHKAVEETANDVDRELALCRRLADAKDLDFRAGSKKPLPHRWDLPARAWREIDPVAGSYEYIDGAFRPNADRVLELVSSTALYAEPFAAVRELVSNGFDGVRAAEALERSQQQEDDAEATRRHKLRLGLESIEGRWWLTCRDTGIGMDKRAIESHFLVAGAPLRSRLLDIARRAQECDSELERSGEFGIGVLSYFMLADKISMTTREIGSEQGWSFEIEGREGFGELRRAADASLGTTVRLRLKENLFEDVDAWADELLAYVRETVVRAPCELEVSFESPEPRAWKAKQGWTSKSAEFVAPLLGSLVRYESDDEFLRLIGEQTRTEAKQKSDAAATMHEDASKRLLWHVRKGKLRHGLGSFRVCIPYWELEDGASRVYMQIDDLRGKRVVRSADHLPFAGHVYSGATSVRTSWYGMSFEIDAGLRLELKSQLSGIIEVDFDSSRAGDIQLRRDQAELSEKATAAVRDLEAKLRRISAELSAKLGSSPYRSFNMVFGLGEGDLDGDAWRWLGPLKKKGPPAWDEVPFPCISDAPLRFEAQSPARARIQGKRVNVLPSLMDAAELSVGLPWHGGAVAPDRLVWFERPDARTTELARGVAPLWLKPPQSFSEADPLCAECPPEWETLCGVYWSNYGNVRATNTRPAVTQRTVWNRGNQLVQLTHEEATEWAARTFDPSEIEGDWPTRLAAAVDPVPHEEIAGDSAYAAAWLLQQFSLGSAQTEGLWAGIAERNSGYLEGVWERLGLVDRSGPRTLMFLSVGDGDLFPSVLNLANPSSWRRLELKAKDDWATLPLPGKAWRLSIESLA